MKYSLSLQAARARCEAATEGPLTVSEGMPPDNRANFWTLMNGHGTLAAMRVVGRANAEFFAHARSDLPAALEALEEAQGQIEAVREYAEKLAEGHVSGTWQGLVKRDIDRILSPERSKEGE